MAIILEQRSYGWAAWFYGVGRMPEDTEIPLPLSSAAPLAVATAHMRKRFPDAVLLYRRNGKLHADDDSSASRLAPSLR